MRALRFFCCITAISAAATGASEAAADPLVVVAGPATGRYAEALPAMVAGARRAASGGTISIEDVDDGCDGGRAEGAARAIAAAKPDLVIGHPCPAAAIAAARVYAAANVLYIALGVRHPELTVKRAGPTIFRLAGRDDRQAVSAAKAILELAPHGRVAIVQDRTAYARQLTAAVTAALAESKIAAPVVVPIVAGRRDYDSELAKLRASPPEVIFFAGYPPEAAVVLRGLRKAGYGAAMVASDANATDEFALAVAAVQTPRAAAVKVMVRAPGSGGFDAGELETAAADAVAAWRAVRDGGGALPAALAQRGRSGPVTFDENGDARLPSFVAVPLVAGRWSKSAHARP